LRQLSSAQLIEMSGSKSMQQNLIKTIYGNIAISQSSGTGIPVLFIHGNSSCKEVFKNQLLGDIGKTYQCIALDLPGHGQSDNAQDPEKAYTMSGYAAMALEVMQNLGIDQFAVMGWSLGGHIGIEMLSQADRINGLMISGTPPIGDDPNDMTEAFLPSEHMAFTGQEILSETEAEAYAHATCGSNSNYESFLGDAVRRTDGRARRIMMQAAIAGEGANQRQEVAQNPTPLAIANGADEQMINNNFLLQIQYQNLWQGQVHLIPAAGHAPFWEAPKQFDLLLNQFLIDLA
jgi:pimeloyl-ACP methyl ester carboxylesterase